VGGDDLRNQAREALRLDIADRIRTVRDQLSTELTFGNATPSAAVPHDPGKPTTALGCMRAGISRVEVSGVHAHPGYLRLYLTLTGQAAVYLPCPG